VQVAEQIVTPHHQRQLRHTRTSAASHILTSKSTKPPPCPVLTTSFGGNACWLFSLGFLASLSLTVTLGRSGADYFYKLNAFPVNQATATKH